MSWEKILIMGFVVFMIIWLSFTTNFIKEVVPSIGDTGKALWDTAADTTQQMKDMPKLVPNK